MEVFIALVTIAAAVLDIILFFKVWGMTNDVKKLKELIYDKKDSSLPIRKEIVRLNMMGYKDKALERLNMRSDEILIELIRDENMTLQSKVNIWEKDLSDLKGWYTYLDAETPEKFTKFDFNEFDKQCKSF